MRPTSRNHAGTRLFVGAGKRSGIRPADLVGAIAGETRVPGNVLGPIKISETFSLVDVPEEFAEEIIDRMRTANLRGKPVTIRRDREAART
jgi:ATP-dependent RNA helicase DeaD